MGIPYQGIIETSSGDLIRAGYSVMTAGEGEARRTDIPFPGKARKPGQPGTHHRWIDAAWVDDIAQPAAVGKDMVFGKLTAEKDILVSNNENGISLTSPDGSIWRETIDDAGVRTWTKQ